MKACRSHRLVVLALAIVSFHCTVTGVSDNYDRVWVRIVYRLADWRVLGEKLDVIQSFLMTGFPFEFNALFREVREDGGPVSKAGDELSDVVDKAIEFLDVLGGLRFM